MGEAESVSQQEFSISTGHGPRLAERAMKLNDVACDFGEKHSMLTPRRSAEIHVLASVIVW